jgi:mRNA interferase MazF
VVLADATNEDWILCQVTSKLYTESRALELTDASFAQGSLHRVSYARPNKLFTANQSLVIKQVGVLKDVVLKQVVEAVVELLRKSIKP